MIEVRVDGRTSQPLVWAAVAAILACGCDFPRPNACPPQLQGVPSLESSGFEWRSDTQNVVEVSGSIVAVSVECVPARHEAIAGERDAFTDYEIAVTATIAYKITDQERFDRNTRLRNVDANLIFEAVSASGVVLGSSMTSFRIVGRGTSGNASSKILGLSEEEIQRLTSVRARWEYGR